MDTVFYLIVAIVVLSSLFGALTCSIWFKKRQNLARISEALISTIISIILIFYAMRTTAMAFLGVIVGMFSFLLISLYFPRKHHKREQSIFTDILHEGPEALALVTAYVFSQSSAIIVTILMCLHNIPESAGAITPYNLKQRIWGRLQGIFSKQFIFILSTIIFINLIVGLGQADIALIMAGSAGAILYVAADELGSN